MATVITEVRDLLNATLVAAGTIDSVYLGIVDDERMVALKDYPFIAIDDGGEEPIDTVVMVQQVKQYNVQIQLGVRELSPEDALLAIIPIWDDLEDVIYHRDNRMLVNAGARIAEGIENFGTVEAGEMTAGTTVANAWKWRKSVIPYRMSFCRGGYHSP
jgi:hypothetical protein